MRSVVLCAVVWCVVGAGVEGRQQARWVPPYGADGPFSEAVIEEGAVGEIAVIRLASGRVPDDLLFYDKDSGAGLLVANYGIFKAGQWPYLDPMLQIEALCVLQLAPGLELTAAKHDDDARDDLVGYQKATGDVYRYYRRGEGCQ